MKKVVKKKKEAPLRKVDAKHVSSVTAKKPVAKKAEKPHVDESPKGVQPKLELVVPKEKVMPVKKVAPKKAPIEAFITPQENVPQIGDKFLVNDGKGEWVGELISQDPLIYRKHHRSKGVTRTEDIEVDPKTVTVEPMDKGEFYRRVA